MTSLAVKTDGAGDAVVVQPGLQQRIGEPRARTVGSGDRIHQHLRRLCGGDRGRVQAAARVVAQGIEQGAGARWGAPATGR